MPSVLDRLSWSIRAEHTLGESRSNADLRVKSTVKMARAEWIHWDPISCCRACVAPVVADEGQPVSSRHSERLRSSWNAGDDCRRDG